MDWILQYYPGFLLFFCRITSFFVVSPVFSAQNVPNPLKLGLAVFVAFISFISLGTSTPVTLDSIFWLLILREILVGLFLGFIAYLFFTVVQIAGAFIDIQIGFGIANVIDPVTGAQSPLMGNLKYMVALLLFFSFNGHHYLLEGIMRSYEWIPLDNELFTHIYNGRISDFMLRTFSEVFALSFQMAAPIIVALFLTDLGLGLLARVSPQFNIFVIGMPLKVLLGLMMLVLLFPGYQLLFKDLFKAMLEAIQRFFGVFAA
ncbi:flagellar biosynthetic protein FliR [Paenibacillus sp. GD4]|uniref:flagellar biosynthetic protein FliR n=1 Tax=Paenibacillus sp. GD4 TaxID=3068890 RepID=UPI002796804C|nr:flagellar biosynthetic protein FliR [Paenibacillus sp. GD4]MDQ1913323.1 flagellar biosynthetic protein FliR [Paenibacillus sp. GD4]